jgi:hypothetical protein
MSTDVIARLESLLNRVLTRRALPRVAAPVAAPILATSPAPKAVAAEAPKPVARPVEVRQPEATPVVVAAPSPPPPQMVEPAPVIHRAATPMVETPRAADVLRETAVAPQRAIDPTPVALTPKASLPLPTPVKVVRADDRVAASFAAASALSPGFGEDDADQLDTLAFGLGRVLPRSSQVPAPPLPVSTRDDSSERRTERVERYAPSLPMSPVVAQVIDPASKLATPSLRALLQRSVALRPRG